MAESQEEDEKVEGQEGTKRRARNASGGSGWGPYSPFVSRFRGMKTNPQMRIVAAMEATRGALFRADLLPRSRGGQSICICKISRCGTVPAGRRGSGRIYFPWVSDATIAPLCARTSRSSSPSRSGTSAMSPPSSASPRTTSSSTAGTSPRSLSRSSRRGRGAPTGSWSSSPP